jgi:hypothetical protein
VGRYHTLRRRDARIKVIAVYILFCAIVSIVSTAMLPDYTNRDISEEHA